MFDDGLYRTSFLINELFSEIARAGHSCSGHKIGKGMGRITSRGLNICLLWNSSSIAFGSAYPKQIFLKSSQSSVMCRTRTPVDELNLDGCSSFRVQFMNA